MFTAGNNWPLHTSRPNYMIFAALEHLCIVRPWVPSCLQTLGEKVAGPCLRRNAKKSSRIPRFWGKL